MKKVLVLCLALVIAVGTAVTGTVAYLQDTDSVENVAVVGDVDIEQMEKQRDDNDGLEDYVQEQNLFPAYPKTANAYEKYVSFDWGSKLTDTPAMSNLWDDANLTGAMDKMVFVKNTGDSPCYYRTWFAFECPDGAEYGDGKEFMLNKNETDFVWETAGYATIKETDEETGAETGEEARYLVMTATYNSALAPKTISVPSLLQVVMTDKATNEVVRALNGEYKVLVYTQAVQTENFPDYKTALDTAFYGVKELNEERTNYLNPWDGEFEEVVAKPADLPVANVIHNKEPGQTVPVTSTPIPLPVQSGVYTFQATETEKEAAASKYANWIADYYVTFNRDMNPTLGDEDATNNVVEGALVGQYDFYDEVNFLEIYESVPANTEIALLKEMGFKFTYLDIVNYVNTFKCGVSVDPYGECVEKGVSVNEFTITVELRLTNPDDPTEYYSIGDKPFEYTYPEDNI